MHIAALQAAYESTVTQGVALGLGISAFQAENHIDVDRLE